MGEGWQLLARTGTGAPAHLATQQLLGIALAPVLAASSRDETRV